MISKPQHTKVITAYVNKTASPPKLIPNLVRWKKMAPDIKPNPMMAPINVVRGININMEANNSPTPVPILPHGSMPSFVNNSTDSGCAVNLKYRVCSRINAATSLNAHVKIVLVIICNITAARLLILSYGWQQIKYSTKLLKIFHTKYLRNKLLWSFYCY